jgi:hypothetical protein
MIAGISSGSMVQVDSNYGSLPYIPPNASNPMQGIMRVNGNNIEVFNGTSWLVMGMSYPTVSLTGAAQAAIHWAQQKMIEEESIKQLAEKHPAVADAMNTINEAYDKLKVVVALTEEENK